MLKSPIVENEVWKGICRYDGDKAPRPNSFNLNFFKSNWLVLKEDFMNFISNFYEHGYLDECLNTSFVALIPKNNNPCILSDYRPIV